jgi:hypothetical protein
MVFHVGGGKAMSNARAVEKNRVGDLVRIIVEPDVGQALGHGVKISRSKDGKLLLKEAGNG